MKPLHPKARIALRWAAYVAGYTTVLLMFFYLTFPFDQLKRRIIAAYAETQGPSAGHLEIDDLTWSFAFPGIVASGVRMVPAALASENSPSGGAASAGSGGAGAQSSESKSKVIELEEMSARLSPLMWLFGTKMIAFSAEGMGGDVDGSIVISSEGRQYSIELHDVSPGQLPTLSEAVGLPLEGKVNGALHLTLPEGKAALAQGDLNLVITDLAIGDGKAKIRQTLALPQVVVGTLEIKASVTSGQLKIEQLKATGPDLELEAEGKLRLRDKIPQSTAEFLVRFNFTDKYRGKSDVTKALFGDPGSSAPGLFDLDPTMKRSKQADGSYNFNVSGSLDKLRYTPTSQRIGSQRSASPAPAPAAATAKKSTSKPSKPRNRAKSASHLSGKGADAGR